jgi:hypothetical protein
MQHGYLARSLQPAQDMLMNTEKSGKRRRGLGIKDRTSYRSLLKVAMTRRVSRGYIYSLPSRPCRREGSANIIKRGRNIGQAPPLFVSAEAACCISLTSPPPPLFFRSPVTVAGSDTEHQSLVHHGSPDLKMDWLER